MKTLATAAVAGLTSADAVAAQTSRYTLHVDRSDRRLVRVEATIQTADSILLMFPDNYDASHLPDGWATFVRSLAAFDGSGSRVDLAAAGRSRWAVPAGTRRPLRLEYEVLVHHDQGNWPVGWDEAAYAKRECDCVMLTGMSVFIGARDLADIGVRFVLPDSVDSRGGWVSVTPWTLAPGGTDSYVVDSFDELSEVAFLIGDMPTRTVSLGGTEVHVAVGRDVPGGTDLVADAVAEHLGVLSSRLGEPPTGRFAVIANRDIFTGGGAFQRSVSMLFEDAPTAATVADWGHIVSHELVHLWNGHSLRFGPSEEWFKEGVTDYLSRLVQLEAGHLDIPGFFEDLANGYRWYLMEAGAATLSEAGSRKQELSTLVYRGGFYAGLALDLQLRSGSNGRVGIFDLLGHLYRLDPDQTVSGETLASAAAELGIPGLSELLGMLAEDPTPIRVPDLLDQLGWLLTLEGDQWRARPDDNASPHQRRLLRQVLGGGSPSIRPPRAPIPQPLYAGGANFDPDATHALWARLARFLSERLGGR